MMRSMFSGVAGLKTHQTKMDVIGNNIANVNTTAYKSSSVNFSELLYQTTSKASGPNAQTGRAGINARQIGLGVQSAAINTNITAAGAAQSTGNPFDVRIKGDAFFIVNDGKSNYFTRDGSFYVDAAGNLAMTSNGYNVMGWGVDQATQTIHQDTVSALRVMTTANMTYPPESTTEAYVDGILDRNEPDATTSSGKTLNLSFYDALGYTYTAKFAIHATETKGEYVVGLADIIDSNGDSLVDVYGVNNISDIASFGQDNTTSVTELRQLITGAHYTPPAAGSPAGTEGTYTKTVEYDELFGDYKQVALSGVTYYIPPQVFDGSGNFDEAHRKAPDGLTGTAAAPQKDIAAGTKIKQGGEGTVTRSKLTKEPYNLIYVEETTDPADPTKTIPAHYEKDGVALPNNPATDADRALWDAALGKTGGTVKGITMNADGDVTFYVESEFTTGKVADYNGTEFVADITQAEAYGVDTSDPNKRYTFDVATDGQAQVTTVTTYHGNMLRFNTDTGKFISINNADSVTLDFNTAAGGAGGTTSLANFSDINIDWTNVTWFNNGGSSTVSGTPGTSGEDGRNKGLGAGRKIGAMDGISIQENGEIYATYDNGMTRLLGQIAVAKFANASGLEKVGENLYSATLNSGEFNGVGVDITADGAGGMVTGTLEMSNVDLSQEFTEMITTQRGFQANSRIITVSDTLLEELVNLKR